MGKPCVAGCEALHDRPPRNRTALIDGQTLARRRLDHDRRHDRQRDDRQAEPDPAAFEAARLAGRVLVLGRRRAAAGGVGERRHARGRAQGARARRDKASASAAPSTCSCSPTGCRSCSSMILGRHAAKRARGAGAAAAVPARRFRRHPRGDGRASGHDPAARSAAARVPALARSSCSSKRPSCASPRATSDPGVSREGRMLAPRARSCTSRTRCSACASAGSASSIPEIYAMQVRAIFEAACDLKRARRRRAARRDDSRRRHAEEMQVTRDAAKAVADEVMARTRLRGRRTASAR